jgi:G3E family GTPase
MNRVPLVLLTGFLGSGKTTLLNRLLATEDFRDTAVIINEAGDVGLDHLLVEQKAETVVMLDGGCLCCRTKGNLIPALAALLRKQRTEALPPFQRIIVETSGLSDPSVLLEELMADVFFNRNFGLAGIVTTIDARAFDATVGDHAEAHMQVVLADRLLITKSDLVPDDQVARVKAALRDINRHAPQVIVASNAIVVSEFWPEALDLPRSSLEIVSESRPAAAPVPIATASLAFDGQLSEDVLEEWLNHTIGLLGPLLLRMKAMLDVENTPGPTALHVVQGLLHRPVDMNTWPGADRKNRIVLIGRGVEQQILVDGLARLAARAVG